MDKGAAEYINLQLEALSTTLPSALRAHLNVELTESSFDVSGKDDIENLILSLSSMLSSCSQEYSSFGKFSSSNQVHTSCAEQSITCSFSVTQFVFFE